MVTDFTAHLPMERVEQRGHSTLGWQATPETLVEVFVSKHEFEHRRPLYTYSTDTFDCSTCGEHVRWAYSPEGGSAEELTMVAKNACSFTATEPFTIKLAVPSGAIVFADSLWHRGLEMPNPPRDIPSYNSSLGRQRYAEFMATQGLAYGAVSNTSPKLYWDEVLSKLIIASPDYAKEPGVPVTWRELGEVWTDLWAYSIMDHDAYLAKGGRIEDFIETAAVRPGFYTFTHYADTAGFDYDAGGVVIFAEATWTPLLALER
jgi:hypothetical protein